MLFFNKKKVQKMVNKEEKYGLTSKELIKEININKIDFINILNKSNFFNNKYDERCYTRYFTLNNNNIIYVNDNEKHYFNIVNVNNFEELKKEAKYIADNIIEITSKFKRCLEVY